MGRGADFGFFNFGFGGGIEHFDGSFHVSCLLFAECGRNVDYNAMRIRV
jgi:hypothetical protein